MRTARAFPALTTLFVVCAGATAAPPDGFPFPPHPLWPVDAVAPSSCQVEMLPGVDASLWNTNLWPGGIVPYSIDAAVTQLNRDRLRIAMDEIQTVANITFVPRTNQPHYLFVRNSTGNSSFVGLVGGGQTVNLVSWSARYVIVHELMHALGVWHEQNRADRDTFVFINDDNIQPQYYNPNFILIPEAEPTGTYDFESVMHYGPCAFSVCCQTGTQCDCPVNCRAIDVRPGYEAFANLMGNRTYMSAGDKSGLAGRYGPPPDDAFEDNDSLSAPAALPVGPAALRLTDTDDYFTVSGEPEGTLSLSFSAALWSSSNVTVSILSAAGDLLASAAPTDADSNGVFDLTVAAPISPGAAVIRVSRSQPWGGQYTLAVQAVPPTCPGDANLDGHIDTADLVLLLGLFGTSVLPGNPADFDNNGVINTADLTVLLGEFGASCF